ncbi:hypothetical protein [Dawidia soli]|uniref:Uncharacterized protein n=1 Tax=Dawidia soli TaxID=2782352 RepID=A0AAP2DD13_9BACT|nr:hypothetical protein [Dawidia soli]MBT1689424.1 hypothetical protein [Dawidia soli]
MTSLESITEHQMMIRELAHGNEEAFRFYYKKYWDVVYHFIFKCYRSGHIAEHGSQQVFACVWQRRASITSIYILQRIIALGCTSVVLKGLKSGRLPEVDIFPKARKTAVSDLVRYTPNLQEHLQQIGLMANDLSKMDQKSTEQFQAELDFLGTFLREARQLSDDRAGKA